MISKKSPHNSVPGMDAGSDDGLGAQESPQRRVAFDMSPAMQAEVARVMRVADLKSVPEVFRRAFTLLRIHVDAAQRNHQVFQVDLNKPNERVLIVLPFAVRRAEPESEA